MTGFRISFFIKILIAIFISGAGFFFILYPEKFGLIEPKYTIGIGIIFVVRGIFRGYSAYRDDFKAEA